MLHILLFLKILLSEIYLYKKINESGAGQNVGKQANVHWTKDPYSYDIVFTTHSKNNIISF